MKIGKTQQTVLNLIDTYKEFELIEYIRGQGGKGSTEMPKLWLYF